LKNINFKEIPILSLLDRVSLARLIPNLEHFRFDPGTLVFTQGEPGDSLYVILDGTVGVILEVDGQAREISRMGPGECFGEMALLTGEPRSATIKALTAVDVLRLSKERFDELIKKHPPLAASFAGLIAHRLAQRNVPLADYPAQSSTARIWPEKPGMGKKGDGKPSVFLSLYWKKKAFWAPLVTLALCVAAFLCLGKTALTTSHIILIELLLAATVIWTFNIVSFHAVAVALPIFAVLFGADNPAKAFAGFSTSSWFLVIGVFAISAAISKTGLLYRLVLMLMKRFPPSYIGQTFGLALSGLLLTPIVPSNNGRVILASPLVLTLNEIIGFKGGSPGAVGMGMSCLLGFGHLSFMFMNGTAVCFLVLGILPPEVNSSITWGYWLKTVLPLGIFFFIASYAAILLIYWPQEKKVQNPIVIEAQLRTLGPLTFREKVSLLTVIVSLIGFVTQSWHQINVAWVAMLSFLILFMSSVLNEKAIRSDIDWIF
jgi:CRP-like cAMP-binding protein